MKREVTRKNDVYAFATSSVGEKKSVRVCACQSPIEAKSAPRAASVSTSARGSQSASGVRASDAQPGDEREHEERERDATLPLVPAPEERDRSEGDEGRDREREQARRRRGRVALQHPVAEREDGGREDEVERQQQKRVLLPDANGDPERRDGEQHHGDDGGIAGERDRAEPGGDDANTQESQPGRLGQEKLDVVVADEGAAETGRREPEEGETGEDEEAVAGQEHERRAGRSEERCDLSGVRVLHGRERYVAMEPRGSSFSLTRSEVAERTEKARQAGPSSGIASVELDGDHDAVAGSDDAAARDLGLVGDDRVELLVADPGCDDLRRLHALLRSLEETERAEDAVAGLDEEVALEPGAASRAWGRGSR